jgi:pilus assembly protein Flp/PilA
MWKFAACFLKDEAGATAIEYGLMATMIAVAIVGVVGAIGGHVEDLLKSGAGLFKAD